MSLLAERLSRLRRQRQLSLRLLGEQSGVPYETISRIETGVSPHPQVQVVLRLALALHVSLDYLVGVSDHPLPHRPYGPVWSG